MGLLNNTYFLIAIVISVIVEYVIAKRKGLNIYVGHEVFTSLAFIGIAFGLLWVAVSGKLNARYTMLGVSVLILVDLLSVDTQYLNKDNFQDKGFYENNLRLGTPVIQDNDPHFRVLNTNIRLDQDGISQPGVGERIVRVHQQRALQVVDGLLRVRYGPCR